MSLLAPSFNTGTYTVKRRVPGTDNADGTYTAAAPTTLSIKASVQVLSSKDLRDLPEGASISDTRWVFTETELRTIRGGDPDVIVIDGDDFRVTKAEYHGVISKHYRCIVERLKVP